MKFDYEQMEFIHPLLRQLLRDLEDWMVDEPTATSLFRIDDLGVHGQLPLRGTDIRCHNQVLGSRAEAYLNSRWQYDPARPAKMVCKYHDAGSGYHLHLQVHQDSIRNDG